MLSRYQIEPGRILNYFVYESLLSFLIVLIVQGFNQNQKIRMAISFEDQYFFSGLIEL